MFICDNFNLRVSLIVPIQYLLTSFCIFVALHSHQDEEESELGISRSLATTPRSPGRRKKVKIPRPYTPQHTNIMESKENIAK